MKRNINTFKVLPVCLSFVLLFGACGMPRFVSKDATYTSERPLAPETTETPPPEGSRPAVPESEAPPEDSAVPAVQIDWKTVTCECTDNEGYTFEITVKLSPWILQSNTALIGSVWDTVGQGNPLPGLKNFGLKEFTGNAYLGEFSDALAANGTRFAATMNDMYYIVGTVSVRNKTEGWSFTADNPGSTRLELRWPSSSPTKVVSKVFYSAETRIYGGTMRVTPSMSSDRWGPVPFVIAHAELFNPNNPNGEYREEVETTEFQLVGNYSGILEYISVAIMDG